MSIILRSYILIGIVFFFTKGPFVQAQHLCGTDEMHQELQKKASQRLRHTRAEELILNNTLYPKQAKTTSEEDYVIPVVVHVIYNGNVGVVSDAQILKGIQHLNESFANAGGYDTSRGVNTHIQFCLAKRDELGNATTGITRTSSPLTNLLAPSQDLALKNLIRWDPTQYLNIWLVNEITSESAGAGVAGYAFFPSSHGTLQDGMVSETAYFGSSIDNSKVHIHELGHYLGLYHTFEGGCLNNNCLINGDRVCDTPPDGSSSPVICPAQVNSCTSDSDDPSVNNPFRAVALGGLGDQLDPVSNYMDYGNSACRVLFTEGQKQRMITALTSLRSSLLQSGGCNDPCPHPIQIAFSASDTNIVVGTQIQFTNTSIGASDFEWYINGVLFSTSQNTDYTFNQQGLYTIKLVAVNGDVICKKELTLVIDVDCSIQASFTGPAAIKPGEAMTYTNTTIGATSYEWFINGASVSTTQHLTHTFPVGGYSLSMVAYDGQCYDTSAILFVQSASCNLGREANIWYFGIWAGLDFSSEPPEVIYSPRESSVPGNFDFIFRVTDEACVSMSDASGRHLFYATPMHIFNKNLDLMPNGSGLLGHSSATQMVSVKDPANENKYYLFTLDAFGNPNGLRYSVIDMTLDGGLGDVEVATKNTLMMTPVTEKVSTVKHANGIDMWVLVHGMNSNAFYAYLVTASGVSTVPVVTNIGAVHAGIGLGQLKFSPDGCKVAVALHQEKIFELLNFNNQTGELSNVLSFSGNIYDGAYGVEFSPDGSKLYIGTELTKNIYQFDLAQVTQAGIAASRVHIANFPGIGGIAAFQLGPYGKIYVARTGKSFLGLIRNPNAPGLLCDFVMDGVNLGDRISGNGLPCFSQQYFYDPQPFIAGPDTVCANASSVKYTVSGSSCASEPVTWSLHGKGIITSFSDREAVIDFSGEEGVDTLIVERMSACGRTADTLFIRVLLNYHLDIRDTVVCSTDPVVLDAGPGFTSYLWQDHSSLQTFSATIPGVYWVTVTSEAGCTMTDTIRVRDPRTNADLLGPDFTRCSGAITVLNAGGGYTSYEWHDHSQEQTFTAFLPGKYWVRVLDACGNEYKDTITISSGTEVLVNLGKDKELCPGETLVVEAGKNYSRYTWQDGSSHSYYTITSPGIYWVMASNSFGCYGYDSIIVTPGMSCCDAIKIPNLFTPNDDGKNDVFEVLCIQSGGWLLEVYNRWGRLVYRSEDYANDWGAQDVSDGVYYYSLKKNESEYKGWVHVVR